MDEYPIVALHKLCKSFEGVQALKNIDFSIYPGEIHCLAGENGSGKSTPPTVVLSNLAPKKSVRFLRAKQSRTEYKSFTKTSRYFQT